MAYEQRDNSGSLFKNTRKQTANHPDYDGQALIGGVEYWVKGWVKEGKKGKFFSLAFTPKQAPRQRDRDEDLGQIERGRVAAQYDDLDDLPF